ncbi:MAG: hypothetical protein ACTHQQ_21960 [Solirubrobacteraceae bacterium]
MITLLNSARRKILGETRAIPFGIAATILLASLTRVLLPHGEWQTAGAFALAAAIITTLIVSLSTDIRSPSNQHSAKHPDPNTTTRTDQ